MEKNRIWTIPNALSVMRLLMIAPIIVCLHSGRTWSALVLMLAGGATDLLDGWLARKLDQRSDLGRIIDPLSDKLAILAIVIFLVLSPRYTYPLWFLGVQLTRELLVLAGGLFLIGRTQEVVESKMSGKMSAMANGIVVILFIFNISPVKTIMLILALGLTLCSTADYAQVFFSVLRQSRATGNQQSGRPE